MSRREVPEIQWRAVLAGGAVALGAGLLLLYMGGPRLNVVAGFAAVAGGALVAGRLTPVAAGLHGGLVGALWIAAEALSDPLFASPPDVVADTALTIVLDALRLGLGIGAGVLGGRLR